MANKDKGNNKGNGNGNGHSNPEEAPKPKGWQTPYQDEEGTFLSYVQKEEDPDETGDTSN